MIDVYSWPTPNGRKIHIMLEECGLEYNAHPVNIGKGEQFEPDFLALSPNNRIPAILDSDGPDGKPISLFESGAILIYLAEKTGQFLPTEPRAKYATLEWLMFQMGGIGPMQGQAVAFERYFPQDVPAARKRYKNETRRLYEVLNGHLAEHEYLADDYSIADIANWSWIKAHRWARVPVDGLDNLQRWIDAIAARPAAQRGIELPPPAGQADKQKSMGASITTQ